MEGITQSTETLMFAGISINLVFSIIFAGLIQYLWGLINTLQLLVMLALFSV